MGLINQDNRKKQDLTNTRTPEDVMRRLAKNVQITTDEVKGLTVEVKGKVDGKEIISTINQSAEAVTINASKININGTISANGNFKVDTSGNMTCNNATMSNASMTNASVSGGNIVLYGNDGSSKIKIEGVNGYTGWAEFSSQNIAAMDGSNNGFFADSRDTFADLFLNRKDNNNNLQFIRFYLDKTSSYSDVQFSLLDTVYSQGHNNFLFNLKNQDGEYGVYIDGRTIIEADYTGVYLYNGSLEEYKKNISKFENGLEIVKNCDIYKFNYKKEEDNYKPHIGIVIGDNYKYRDEILNNEKDGVDTYSMISVLWKAVQEQQKEIEELKKVIK